MIADTLIARLSKVRRTGPGRWMACCPAHEDRSPSLCVTEVEDGRVLIHCFGGCAPDAVLAAVGLTFDALYPERAITDAHASPRRVHFNARDVLRAVSYELLVCQIYLHDKKEGRAMSDDDTRRFRIAVERVEEARSYANAR